MDYGVYGRMKIFSLNRYIRYERTRWISRRVPIPVLLVLYELLNTYCTLYTEYSMQKGSHRISKVEMHVQ